MSKISEIAANTTVKFMRSTPSLLTPVPLEHLRSGVDVCLEQGKVAFGSRAWEVFRELDAKRHGSPVDVFIYASSDQNSISIEVSWRGRYIGHVESKGGAHPDGLRFRPLSTQKNSSDNKGHWAVFWELDQLRELSQEERVPIKDFIGYSSGKKYKKGFIPEGPLIVVSPT